MSQNKELPLVVCSVDGALLGQHGRLLACDELTIRLYCAMGGQFSALTYRTPQGLELTTLTAYGDKTVQIEACGKPGSAPAPAAAAAWCIPRPAAL